MSRKKLRTHQTNTDNLISNLRGEVGEIIFTWIMMRDLKIEANSLQTDDPGEDMDNQHLKILFILIDKLSDEIVARLSELAEKKVGRLTFHFANEKLGGLDQYINNFNRFIEKNRFREKRNYDISHKELPEKWSDHKHIHIPYKVLLKGIAYSLRLMKKIDEKKLGPSSMYLWREMRKRRYEPIVPVKAGYLLLPHLFLCEQDRLKIIIEELKEGRHVWNEMDTIIDGVERKVKVSKEWGVIMLGQRLIALSDYPLQKLTSINTNIKDDSRTNEIPL